MGRKKKISKRQKVFNVISNTIDIVQEYYLRGMFLLFLMVYVLVVYKIDAIAEILFEMRYGQRRKNYNCSNLSLIKFFDFNKYD